MSSKHKSIIDIISDHSTVIIAPMIKSGVVTIHNTLLIGRTVMP